MKQFFKNFFTSVHGPIILTCLCLILVIGAVTSMVPAADQAVDKSDCRHPYARLVNQGETDAGTDYVFRWLLSFNVFTIAGAALAFYFYFASSFDILALLPFVARLLMDLSVMLSAATWYVWLVIGWRLLCKLREHIGYGNLDHMERRNQLALKELKRLVDECNQLNDGFEDYLKMIRHPSVIRNHVYIFFITDGNRAMDWSAGGREVCSILTVKEVSAQFVAMPLFVFACMLYDFFKPRHDAFMKEYESTRDDMCLPVQIYMSVCSFFFNRHERCANRYGFKQVQIGMQTGKMEGEEKLLTWYRLYKKDYSDRYSTDCHRGLFEARINRATIGVQDYPTYRTTKATGPELDQTHSYFITDVRKKFGEGEK